MVSLACREGHCLAGPACAPLPLGMLLARPWATCESCRRSLWSSLLWQQQMFLQGSSYMAVIHGQNIVICLHSSRALLLLQGQVEG